MGLKIVSVAILIGLLGCMARKNVVVGNVKHYYDCCSPSLQADAKIGCRVAKNYPNNTIIDENGDRYIFIWSDCEVGKEPWRKWEN